MEDVDSVEQNLRQSIEEEKAMLVIQSLFSITLKSSYALALVLYLLNLYLTLVKISCAKRLAKSGHSYRIKQSLKQLEKVVKYKQTNKQAKKIAVIYVLNCCRVLQR